MRTCEAGLTSTDAFLIKFFPSIYEERKNTVIVNQYCKFDSQVLTLFSSSLFLSAMVAAFFAGPLTRSHGRKWTLFAGGLTYVVGACVSGVAVNFPMLLTGRILVGAGVGLSIQVAPLYISEMAPAQQRGMLNILFQLMITVGILSASMTNYLSSKIPGGWGWRIAVAFGAIPAAVIALGALVIPDTPTSLIVRGDTATARKTLLQIRGVGDVREEFDDLSAASEDAKAVASPWRELFFGGKYKPQLTFALLLPFFQQLTGINVIMFYAPVLFKTIGLGGDAALMSAVVTGLVNIAATFVSIATVDRLGRRKLFFQGGCQMLLCQVIVGTLIGVMFGGDDEAKIPRTSAATVVAFICVYVAGFAWSWGPLGVLVPSEIFPLEIRPAGQGINVAVNMLCTFAVAQAFLPMLCHLRFGLFYFFAGWVLAMTLFVAAFLPETKGVPIERMGTVWRAHWFWQRFVVDGTDAGAENCDAEMDCCTKTKGNDIAL